MNVKSRNISSLIESQIPQFIVGEYPFFVKFLESYYAQQELSGGVLDIVTNLTEYRDINFYSKDILKQSSKTTAVTGFSDTTISVDSTDGFPDEGLAKVGDEIFFYQSKTDTSFTEISRGVSGNTSLGNLYSTSTFVSTDAKTHASGSTVHNISNLFLYALIQSFESEYLAGVPEKYLRGEIDKRTLIKHISSFYKAKGTKRSIQFIFNSLIASDDTDVYYPKDITLKSSESDWITDYTLKVIAVQGNPEDLVGKTIVQSGDVYASAVVDNVRKAQSVDGTQIWELIIAPSSINNVFSVSNKTKLTKAIDNTDQVGSKIYVDSTFGWDKEGTILIGSEVITYSSKTIKQYTIKSRVSTQTHNVGTIIYDNKKIVSGDVQILALGVVYNLSPKANVPYGIEGETVVVEDSGFDTIDSIIKNQLGQVRWEMSDSTAVSSGDPRTLSENTDTIPGIAEVFSDENNYYFCTNGFPKRTVYHNQTISADTTPVSQSLLRTIRKTPLTTTEVYQSPRKDIGIMVDGTLAYSYKDTGSVFFGKLTKITVNNQGSAYTRAPFVLVNNTPYKATANMSGSVVETISINDTSSYTVAPTIDIVSGRNAVLTPVVTGGAITSLVIADAGEYYSAPPTIRIVDKLGKGRFAEFTAEVSATGQITSTTPINTGSFYTTENVVIQIIPAGSGATATSSIFEWVKNRYAYATKDTEYGFSHLNDQGFYNYGVLSYSPSLQTSLSDDGTNHSPIIGYAYDGNPIYGPYGYTDAADSSTAIIKMTSGYILRTARPNGPSVATYPLGSFIQDYYYADRTSTLDKNNGRYCVTPDYPDGVYAYFVTLDSTDVPVYPYIIGKNFYSLPLASNYDQNQTQNDIPTDAVRLRTTTSPNNGLQVRAVTKDTAPGSISNFTVFSSSNNFKVGSELFLDNSGTGGTEASGTVESIKGKDIIEVRATDKQRVAKVQLTENCYVFSGDTLTQPSSGAYGTVVGDVLDGKILVLQDVVGNFDDSGIFDATTLSINMVLNTNATFTKGATVELTNGTVNQTNPPSILATGEVIESTDKRNSVKVKVLSGTFVQTTGYYLRSDNLLNTVGAEILSTKSLSTGLVPFQVNTNIALVKTDGDHELGIGDKIFISIDPNDSITTTTKYVQLGAIQEIDVEPPTYKSALNDAGIGRVDLLNSGADYTSNTYTDIELTGGKGTGAKATVLVVNSIVQTVTITTKGSGYEKGDVLTVADVDLVRSAASTNTNRLRVRVDHIGFAAGETTLNLDSIFGLSKNDLLTVGEEVVKITDIGSTSVTVTRAQEGTTDSDHFDNEAVTLYNTDYRFTVGESIAVTGNTALDPKVLSFANNKLTVEHNNSFFNQGDFAPYKVTTQSTLFDESDPKRTLKITAVSEFKIVTKISDSVNGPYTISPNINIQEFYQYRFDLSHFTNDKSEFIISPSKNDNIIAPEVVNVGTPGQPDSYAYVKFGYGARLGTIDLTGTLTKRVPRRYQRYYYKSVVRTTANGDAEIRIGPSTSIVDSDSFMEIINDPLQGRQIITDALTTSGDSQGQAVSFVTSDRFVYEMTQVPEWYGTGTQKYTSESRSAIGGIDNIKVANLGSGYKQVPIVKGCELHPAYSSTVTAEWDSVNNNIVGVIVDTPGSNYSKPIVVVSDGNGTEAEFEVLKTADNKVARVTVINKGKNYTYKPSLKVVEGDLRAYALGDSIGITKNVEMEFNGAGIWDDTSTIRRHSCSDVLIVDTTDNFLNGEQVKQGNSIGHVVPNGWRPGSNILKISVKSGEFVSGTPVLGTASKASGSVLKVLKTEFDVDLRSYYDNLGTFTSDKGKVGVRTHKIADNNFYQDYSYVVESKTDINKWRDLIKESVHPAGFKLFGELNVDSNAAVSISNNSKTNQVSTLKLWNEETNKVTVGDTKRYHQTVVNLSENINLIRGTGSFTEKSSDTSGIIAREIKLTPAFDGDFDANGNISGTREFTIVDVGTNAPITPYNAMALTITLDGILQEPEVAYTLDANKITFAKAPFGPRTDNNATTKATKFVGRLFQFKDASQNATYLKKIRQIFQREGTWIDAANQLRFNRTFIQEEAIGYVKAKYPSLTWNTLESKCMRDIGLLVDSYEHDLRFGGNASTYDAAKKYFNDGSLAYIDAQLTESIAAYEYTMNLCVAAARNWDLSMKNCIVTQGTNTITVPSTLGICIGMNVSTGSQFAPDTTVTEILSPTSIRVSRDAELSYAGQTITTLVTNTGNTSYGPTVISSTGTLNISPSATTTIYSSINNIDEVTFSFARTNTGKFMDAARLIRKNKKYIQEESLGWVKATYPNLVIPDEDKCERDTGYLIDAYVYHLQYGGNFNVVDFAERYYTGYTLSHIASQKAESIAAFNKAKDLMVVAMKNNLGAGTYTAISPFTDAILPDPQGVLYMCAEVEQTLDTYNTIVASVINKGPYTIEKVSDNNQRNGNWTTMQTFSNINILAKEDVFTECADVVSALNSLFLNVKEILNGNSATKSLPDYFNGDNTDFELYYTDNTPVKTSVKQDLFVGINGIFQNAKYDETFPRLNSYYIKRSAGASDPDRIVFAEPPKWEQKANTLTVQEPLAVEKFFAHNVGGYKRLIIQGENFNGSTLGPFVMRDEEVKDVVVVDDDRFVLVFVDGILQERTRAYSINESSITFTQPPREGQRVDIVLLVGISTDQILDGYNIEPNNFMNEVTVNVTGLDSAYDSFSNTKDGQIIWQFTDNTYPTPDEYTTIGMVRGHGLVSGGWEFIMSAQNPDIDFTKPLRIAANTDYINASYIEVDLSTATTSVTYATEDGRRVMKKDTAGWLYASARPNMTNVEPGDKIIIDGETDYRTVKKVPSRVNPLDYVPDTQASSASVGTVTVSNYNGLSRGEGLDVKAVLTGDVVTSLTWNKRDLSRNPDAYQYDTPPVLSIEPVNDNGGGAKAHVVVDGGEVIDVILTSGGSGYTAIPTVNVSRGYKIIKGHRQFDSKYTKYIEHIVTGTNTLSTASSIGEATRLAYEFSHSVAAVSSQNNVLEVTQQLLRNVSAPAITQEIVLQPKESNVSNNIVSILSTPGNTVKQIKTSALASSTQETKLTSPSLAPAMTMVSTFDSKKADLLDVDLNWGDAYVMVPSTTGFDPSGSLQVGEYYIEYSSKLSDRFVIRYNAAVVTATIATTGTGYPNSGTAACTGGDGSGLQVSYTAVSGALVSVSISNAGLDYNAGNVVTVTGGTISATLTITDVVTNSTSTRGVASVAPATISAGTLVRQV